MEIRLGTLADSQLAVAILNRSEGLDSVPAYRIMKNFKAISDEAENYEKQRIKLCEKYAEKDEEGNPAIKKTKDGDVYVITKENEEKYQEELKALQDELVDVKIRKVSLTDINPAKLAPGFIGAIEFMLDIPDED